MVPAAALARMGLRYSLVCAVVKTTFTLLEPQEVQAIIPSKRTTYTRWIASKSRKRAFQGRAIHDIQLLPTGKDSAILWLGDRRRAKKVVLYNHGGGYVMPMMPGHLDLCWESFVSTGAETGVEVAVALLQYTLVPRGRMPTQLSQVVAAFNEIRSQGFAPRDIIVGEESGGGNLTMQLVGHLLKAHPDVPRVTLGEPLAGVVSMSPALGSNGTTRSFQENEKYDMITEPPVRKLAVGMLSEGETEKLELVDNPWARPLDSDPAVYSRLAEVTVKIYFMTGDRELLADHARFMAGLVKKQAPDVIVALDEVVGQPHSGILLEALVGEVGQSTKNIKKWFREVIAAS
ncbi:hypothetical protein VHEMI09706 [[Torrubiella] hemipterigena]|uniref:Alpha/beta hydrolase fold-3 domain-containing protein n=1 Tax=[Torrubiella] hemipterigena TaxID=1531966 RepID=A0A0A1TAQ2_9HYPO|nr:hypothetical protein VHEMI09706 [[Torrubiella] hemipterigena]